MRKAYIESFIILLFLSCCPFIVSSCHEEEKEEIPESPFDEEDIQHEQDLNAYLGKSYSCKIIRFTHYMYRMKTTSNKLITNIL